MRIILLAFVVCVISQQYEGPTTGVCIDTIGGKTVSPPNYSKNGESVTACRNKCNQDTLCVGFSHAVDLGSAKNRCAIWIDRTVLTTRGNDYKEWEVHNYPGWEENVLEIESGDNAQKWECYVRIDTCPAGTATRNGVTVSYPEIDQGRYVDKQCSEGDSMTNGTIRIECQNGTPVVTGSCIRDCAAGSFMTGGLTMTYGRISHAGMVTLNCADFDPTYEGTVQVSCNNGTASKGTGTCAQKEIPEWTDMGKGVCRDTTVGGPYTRSVGPGVSPPNFSREGYTLEKCKEECEKDTLTCAGISHGGTSGTRCALFLNVSIADCGKKSGWTAYPYQYGWTVGVSEIDGASGEAFWKCEKRKLPELLTTDFTLLPGHGVCANSQNLSPPNYSDDGKSQGECLTECASRKDCLAFAHDMNGQRCALWMQVAITTPETVTPPAATGLGSWSRNNGELGWKNDPVISKADESGGQWLCYKKGARRKN